MKVKNPNELWLLNVTTSDVHLSDLGVKVPAGKAVNIYHANPYLTTHQVQGSREIGSLAKRLAAGTLKIVKKAVRDAPQVLKNIKESNESNLKAIKTKSSVVLEPDDKVDEESGEGFEFADYGVIDMGPSAERGKQEDGTVVIEAKQDDDGEPDPGAPISPVLESGISKQSQVVMKVAQESMVDPTGPHAEASHASYSQPFTVIKPPAPPEVEEPESEQKTTSKEEAEAAARAARKKVSKDSSGTVVVDGETKHRSIKAVKHAQEEGVETDEADDGKGIEFNETEYDSKVATKTKDGAIVMKLKEEEKEPEAQKVVTKKARPSKKK